MQASDLHLNRLWNQQAPSCPEPSPNAPYHSSKVTSVQC